MQPGDRSDRDPTDSAHPATPVYKVLTAEQWAGCDGASFDGSPDDHRDGFLHLSTGDQLAGTVERHFAGRSGLVVLELAADDLGPALRWEPSRGGGLFPHLYGPLPLDRVRSVRVWDGDAG